jgi:hypothetical protein
MALVLPLYVDRLIGRVEVRFALNSVPYNWNY